MKTIVVHGLGYVGLTAAVHFAKAGWRVFGYDPDHATISRMRAGKPRAGEFLAYLDADVGALIDAGALIPTHALEDVVGEDVHLLAVPSERDGEPYMSIVADVVQRLVRDPGSKTIIVESTLTPGTVDHIFRFDTDAPISLGQHHVAVCPRRDWFADQDRNLATIPRVVGGVTKACTAAAVEVLRTVSPHIEETDYLTAELTKALENALLHVPVMMAHELAIELPHRNVAEALRLAGSHWRLPQYHIGFGTGGRCVPLGTRYLHRSSLNEIASLREAMRADHRARAAAALAVMHRGCKTALVLGVAYRPNFRDAGLSPGLGVARELLQYGVKVTVADPMWSQEELEKLTGFSVQTHQHLVGFDAVLLATPHDVYQDPRAFVWRVVGGQFVLDAQGAWAAHASLLERSGIEYKQVGTPGWLG